MTEIDALKYELKQERQAFNKLHKKYIELLNQQGELEKENRKLDNQLNKYIVDYNGLNCEWHHLKTEKEELEKENQKLKKQLILAKPLYSRRELERENKELKEETQQLKEQLEICKDARQSYKQDWKACVSYCDTYKDEIHTLKDNIQGVIEENKELKRDRNYWKTLAQSLVKKNEKGGFPND